MEFLFYLIWALIGAGLAILFLKTQIFSSKMISPENPRLSKWLIVGGAFIRWVFIFGFFVLALSYSIGALLITFVTFMITRLIFLMRWHANLDSGQEQTQ